MALLKDLIVFGAARFISDTFGNNIYANKHITNGGTNTQFVRGDGTLQNINTLATSGHNHGVSKTAWGQTYVDANGNLQTISGNMTSVGNVTPISTNNYILGSTTILWQWIHTNKINLNRAGNAAYGRIYYYNASYYTWVDYMSNSAAGAAPTGGQPSTTTEVTAWAKRSLIENASGYGWIWEACTNAAASATSTKPTARMSLSSYTGQLRIEANASSTSNNTGGLIVSSALNGNQNNISIELWRGTNASWSISNESGDLHIRDNYTTAVQTTFLHDNIKVAYNTGTITARIIQPFTTNEYTLGSSSLRWKALYVGTSDSYGSTTKPIYWNAGVPAACTYELKATINGGTANRIAYYSGANAISAGSIVTNGSYIHIVNDTDVSGTAADTSAPFTIGTLTGTHISMDGNEILAKTNATTPGILYLQDTTGTVQVNGSGGLKVWDINIATGATTDTAKCTISSSSTLYLNSAASTSIIFNKNGAEMARFDTSSNFVPSATNTRNLGSSSLRWAKLYIGGSDSYGSTTKPIYWNAGVPAACTYELKATINDGAANRMAYYSGANAISQASSIYASTTALSINKTSAPANSGNFQVVGTSTMRHIYPESNNTYNLGSTSLRWANVFGVLGNYSGQVTVSVATGTAPFAITSTTKVNNLNVDLLDGYHAGNSSGQIPISNGTRNVNLNADLLDGYHASMWFKTAAADPNGKSDKPYHLVAEFSQNNASSQINTGISLFVRKFYGATSKESGILVIRCRYESNAATPAFIHASWSLNNSLPIADFILTYKRASNVVTLKLYAKLTGWNIYCFRKIDEGGWGINEDTWSLYNATNSTSYAMATIPSDETQVASELINISNHSVSATNVYVNQNISSNAWYPLVWSNQNNTTSALGNQLHKSYDYLLYNPSTKELRVDGGVFIRPGRDATLKIYSGKVTDGYSDGFIKLQTSIDGTDGQSHSYPGSYQARCAIFLQPRGGEVYIGKDITAASTSANASYKLNVGGQSYFGNEKSTAAYKNVITIFHDAYSSQTSNNSTAYNGEGSWGLSFDRGWSDSYNSVNSAGIYAYGTGSWGTGLVFRVKGSTSYNTGHDRTALDLLANGKVKGAYGFIGNLEGTATNATNVYIEGASGDVTYAMLFTTATANGNGRIYADTQWRTAGITFNPSSNTLNVGSRIIVPYANLNHASMRHLDAGLNSVNTDHGLYIGYGAQTYTAVTHFYYSTGTTDTTSSRTEFMQINSNGAYALTRFGVNGQNTSYNFYVNGTSYFNGNVTHNGIIYLANGTTYYINNSAVGYLNDLRVDQIRLVDNWIGFYQSNNAGGNRYGYIQTDGSYMYFRKENGNNGFNFNGNLVPDTSNSKYLGTSSYYWHGAYINGNGNIHWNNLVKLSNTNIITTDTNRGLPRILANQSTNMQQSGNRFYGLNPNSVKIEYTTNGSTWTTQTTSTFNTNLDTYKRYFTQGHWGTSAYPTRVGNVADAASGATCSIAVNMGTRITLDMRQENRTGWVECLSIYFLTRGHNCSFTVERQNTSSGTWTTIETGTLNNTNQIRTIYPTTSFYLQGNGTSTNAQYANIIRITMIVTALGTAQRYAPMVGGICGIGTGGVGQTRNASYTVGRRSDLTMAQWGLPLEISKPNNSVLAHGDYWQFYGAGGWIAANTNNYADVYIGTGVNKSVAGEHAEGRLFIYSAATHYHAIYTTSTTTHYYHYLPNSTGWIATGGNGSNTGAGSATNPVYLSTSGVLTGTTYSLSATVNAGTASRIAYYSGANAISAGSITTNGSYLRSVTDLNSIHITPVTLSDSTAWTTNFDTNVFGSADNTNYKFTVIRGNAHVPAEFTSDWSCGIAFKGSDTKGMMSISYNNPQIKFAGGSGTSNLNWWMGIKGTKEIIYNLDSWRPESITNLDTDGTKNGIYSHNNAATGRPSDNYGNLINISNQEIPAPGTANHWIQQLDFTHDGLLHHRRRINTSAWSGWATILDSSHAYIATTPVKTTSTPAQNITGTGNITPNSNNTYALGSSSLRWSKLYVGSADSYGNATKPIYWNAGVPAACTYSLSATVNAGTASRIAYYSGANAISAGSIVTNGYTLQIGTDIASSANDNNAPGLKLKSVYYTSQNIDLTGFTTNIPAHITHRYTSAANSTITFPTPSATLEGSIVFLDRTYRGKSSGAVSIENWYHITASGSTDSKPYMLNDSGNLHRYIEHKGGWTKVSTFYMCIYYAPSSKYVWREYICMGDY